MADEKIPPRQLSGTGDRILRNNKEYILLDKKRVYKGTKEAYNRENIPKRNWLVVDLETGSRGWYPGSALRGRLLQENVPVKQDASDESVTIRTITKPAVTILSGKTPIVAEDRTQWYQIKTTIIENNESYTFNGYIKTDFIDANFYYEERTLDYKD